LLGVLIPRFLQPISVRAEIGAFKVIGKRRLSARSGKDGNLPHFFCRTV
jgi:hypothetical protein